MSKNLVIVESPAKARTIEKYLGKDYKVLASFGHVRDLIAKDGAVDVDHDFEMHYEIVTRNAKQVSEISKALKKADNLMLATDPDREGEAIAWHLLELLKQRGEVEDKQVSRVVFHEITKRAIQQAVAKPRELATDLIEAQQARRALDFLVGFKLSPLLWRKIQRGLSAGRVQSPALRLICERDEQIKAFVPREYWTIDAHTHKDEQPFSARLTRLDGEKVEQFTVHSQTGADAALKTLTNAAGGKLTVVKVNKRQRKRNPAPPFTTSTLQQEAARKLGFTASRTMRVAQSLYEGVAVNGDSVGLITYMRTDSVNLANEALAEIRSTIESTYGAQALPDSPRSYKTRSKNAQEAHEAIRPTSSTRSPESIKSFLNSDQAKLYNLIWKRTVACQMVHAVFDTVAAEIAPGQKAIIDSPHLFRANGSTLKKPGFLAVYQEGDDQPKKANKDKDKVLPPLTEGDELDLAELVPDQHFTEPPPRYTEAALVKTLEEYDIGRPSTYAAIISKLQQREYVDMDGKAFIPTSLGKIVNKFLTDHFTRYVDYEFTARLEDALDAIARGEKQWKPLLAEFWEGLSKQIEQKQDLTREEVAQARQLGTDPKSGKPVIVRIGRYGPFVQIGSKDDEEKPKFAGLRKGQDMDEITLDEALYLFNLPRDLGEDEDGEPIRANIGPFGPYVQLGKKGKGKKPLYVNLKEDDPYTIGLERAKQLIAAKKQAEADKIIHNFKDAGIVVQHGRYGPFITNGELNAGVPKDQDPKELTEQQCEQILEQSGKPPRSKRRKKTAASTKKKTAAKKKTTTKKATAKKSTTKKTTTKKASAKKPAAKKTTTKKTASKKTTKK